ncbi:MAG TPA: hypothetical protein VGX00_04155 [Thermoplasmata archaeon]|nr:hypothetical protein [Thermoplasmata archaeon]
MNQGAETLENDALAIAELACLRTHGSPPPLRTVRRLGRVRLPIAGPYRPWATAYRLPDGRRVWCVRLWAGDRPYPHCVSTSTLRAFCRINRLPRLAAEVERIARR